MAAALAAATLVSTLTSLFGRARLQRRCDNYRAEISEGTSATKEVVEALHLKWLAQLIARDTYPARWTLFAAHACVLFGILMSVLFGQLVATQATEIGGGDPLLASLFILVIFPYYSTNQYLSVVFKRTEIRREIAERAAGKAVGDANDIDAISNWRFFCICVGATIPSVISFFVSYGFSLGGSAFSGPSWVTSTMSIVSVVVVLFGGISSWHYLPRLSDKLEALAVETIANLPKRPNEREDELTAMKERAKTVAMASQKKREKRELHKNG